MSQPKDPLGISSGIGDANYAALRFASGSSAFSPYASAFKQAAAGSWLIGTHHDGLPWQTGRYDIHFVLRSLRVEKVDNRAC